MASGLWPRAARRGQGPAACDLSRRAAEIGLGGSFLSHDLRLEFGGASLLGVRKALDGLARRSRLLSSGTVSVGMPLPGTVGAAVAFGHFGEGPPMIVRLPVEHSIPTPGRMGSPVRTPPSHCGC